jgi:hypothetical protein
MTTIATEPATGGTPSRALTRAHDMLEHPGDGGPGAERGRRFRPPGHPMGGSAVSAPSVISLSDAAVTQFSADSETTGALTQLRADPTPFVVVDDSLLAERSRRAGNDDSCVRPDITVALRCPAV